MFSLLLALSCFLGLSHLLSMSELPHHYFCWSLLFEFHRFWLVFFDNIFGILLLQVLWLHFGLYLKDVILEEPFSDFSVGQCQLTCSMLSTKLPFAFVGGPIIPIHLTVSMAHVVGIATDVIVATLPIELALTVLLVLDVASLILVAVDLLIIFLPFSFSLLVAINEVASVRGARFPLVLPTAIW